MPRYAMITNSQFELSTERHFHFISRQTQVIAIAAVGLL